MVVAPVPGACPSATGYVRLVTLFSSLVPPGLGSDLGSCGRSCVPGCSATPRSLDGSFVISMPGVIASPAMCRSLHHAIDNADAFT